MDGTLLPLAIEPSCDDAADYHGRKFRYSLSVMVICDDRRKIRAYLSGFAGCCHDNRIWQFMDQHTQQEKHFAIVEYILCDTAFEPGNHAIPAFKAVRGQVLDRKENKFNFAMAKPRVISEHTNGIWKGRFPWLRHIRMQITNERKSLKRILRYIEATVVLHNVLIDLGADARGDDWDCEDDLTDIDEPDRAPDDLELYGLDHVVPRGLNKGTRREQLKEFIWDKWHPTYNYRSQSDDSSDSS
ncbi:hypothetical protein THAOC_11945 [Thalassiosira oceanica]|uniref:DDE Tnp4 domain-containing protein n=1 Tax=Thalassiosira oceanica TaxID=159749 RepID=K0T947_THAOC|nr:hypothetical protein THAOC_11945 [Thalassiosira oceanica]|eukprot:EJK67067.1 hypothetical protein THAOC_11945 [Thalassiosira oceanica]